MSGAVSGHQSARQRQALQIISGDEEGKEKRGRGIVGKVRECGDSTGGRPQCSVFNIRLLRVTQTGQHAEQTHNHNTIRSLCPPLSYHQLHKSQCFMMSFNPAQFSC